ncbi:MULTISPECIES: cyclase [unclassified Exiguobacterium]|uniref:cyclase n=1 Tax=unclassified Exiguobacterium TaxID=2644629 RepID=UPI0015754B10|nr:MULTISPECIES: cyclase [unclassified Exiguobacterium]MCQ4091259.1 cyclase [Exiguobacterium sp. LL15]NTY08144.1 cyclase [Exiguobacterium sp. JMULE1]
MHIEQSSIVVDQTTVSYDHFQMGSKQVCFLISGASYLYDHPYFYYSRMALLARDIDVICIHYVTEELFSMSDAESNACMTRRVDAVVSEVLATHTYENVQFIAKSLGTIPLAALLAKPNLQTARFVFLTPVLTEVAEQIATSSQAGLLVIGTADKFYDEVALETCHTSQLTIDVMEGANHSLDQGFEVDQSLAVLGHVVRQIEASLFEPLPK